MFDVKLPTDSSWKWKTISPDYCFNCRSQIESETRQKCYTELINQLGWLSGKSPGDPNVIYIISPKQLDKLKQEWEIEK